MRAYKSLLKIKNLNVSVRKKPVLNNINLDIKPGEVHILFGPNGAGKSTLLSAIMSLPGITKQGEIWFKGLRIDTKPTATIANLGLGIAFQRPPSIRGVRVKEFMHAINAPEDLLSHSSLCLADFNTRELNVGFSGGEIKRWEILKLFAQDPDLILLDEPESGVDVENIAIIGKAINELINKGKKRSALIITHVGLILKYVRAHKGHILNEGTIIRSGDPKQLFKTIQKKGYQRG